MFLSRLVTLQLHNLTSAVNSNATVLFQCTPGSYGDLGKYCATCPKGGLCLGQNVPPEALPGYFPLPVVVVEGNAGGGLNFIECSPTEACIGGSVVGVTVSSTRVIGGAALCNDLYSGLQCSICNKGAYRCAIGVIFTLYTFPYFIELRWGRASS